MAMSKFFCIKSILLVSIFTFSFNHLVFAQDYEGTDTLYITNPLINATTQDTLLIWYCNFPTFSGGNQAFTNFMQTHFNFPQIHSQLKGVIHVRLTFSRDGCIKTARILNSLREDHDQELLRVLYLMPAWKVDSRATNQQAFELTLPIRFGIKE
jgi:hypothetical protein